MTQTNVLPEINFTLWSHSSDKPNFVHETEGVKVSNLLLIHSLGFAKSISPGFALSTDLIAIMVNGIRILKDQVVFVDTLQNQIQQVLWYYDTGITKELAKDIV